MVKKSNIWISRILYLLLQSTNCATGFSRIRWVIQTAEADKILKIGKITKCYLISTTLMLIILYYVYFKKQFLIRTKPVIISPKKLLSLYLISINTLKTMYYQSKLEANEISK